MSSVNSGNLFSNIVNNLLTLSLKRSKRIAKKKEAGRPSYLPRNYRALLLA